MSVNEDMPASTVEGGATWLKGADLLRRSATAAAGIGAPGALALLGTVEDDLALNERGEPDEDAVVH